jgi:septal ring factor EnvC (AmiA/AmiB activator)
MSPHCSRQSNRVYASVFAGVLLLWSQLSSASDDVSQEQLNSVRTQLTHQNQDISKATAQLAKLRNQLQQDETAIANLSRDIRRTTTQINQLAQQQTALEQQQIELEARRKTQQEQLTRQIQAAYQLGKGDYLKMLLSEPKTLPSQRMMSYYAYLNQARLDSIKALEQTNQALNDNREQLELKLAEQITLKSQQRNEQETLKQQRAKRAENVRQSNQLLQNERLALEELKTAETYLSRQLKAQSERQLKAQSERQKVAQLNGLKKHSLQWPIKGSITQRYGSPHVGQSRWQGTVISAKLSTPIQAVADGKVVFADWMRGYGLVIAIDHGHDYLTLYGYNQELIKNLGESVKKGDIIATVGNSGGQSSPSLYFQVRYKGQAQNPSLWIK